MTCLNQQGIYNPAMSLIITSQERFTSVRGTSTRDDLYEILFSGISNCGAHNNYTMEFEYLIYSNSSKIDRAVLQCGVVYPFTNPPCWGQSYVIIRYDTELVTTTTSMSSPATLSTTELQTTTTNMCSSPTIVTIGLSQEQSGLASSIAILAVIVITETVLLVLLSMYMIMRSQRKNRIALAPLERQSLVMKTVRANEKAAEQAITCTSSTQTELNPKLLDKKSSWDTRSKYVIKF